MVKTYSARRVPLTKKSESLNDNLDETEELIKIFVASIKTAEKKQKRPWKIWHRIQEHQWV